MNNIKDFNIKDTNLTRDFDARDWPAFAYHKCNGHIDKVPLSKELALAIHRAANITVPMLFNVDNDMSAYPKAITLIFFSAGLVPKRVDSSLPVEQYPMVNQMKLLCIFTQLSVMGNILAKEYNTHNKMISILDIAQHLKDFLKNLYSEGYVFE